MFTQRSWCATLKRLVLAEVEQEVLAAGALPAPVRTSCEVIRTQASTQGAMAIEYEK